MTDVSSKTDIPFLSFDFTSVQNCLEADQTFQSDLRTFANGFRNRIIECKVQDNRARNIEIFTIITAVAVMVGGIFAILAAHQILPSKGNLLSRLNPWGYVISYGVEPLAIIAIVLSVKFRNRAFDAYVSKRGAEGRIYDENMPTLTQAAVQRVLKNENVLAISYREGYVLITKESVCYYRRWIYKQNNNTEFHTTIDKCITYSEWLDMKHQKTLKLHKELLEDKIFIDITTLSSPWNSPVLKSLHYYISTTKSSMLNDEQEKKLPDNRQLNDRRRASPDEG